ncbi:hypothetical protein [Kaistia sp. MMO-174]|uniref:hypothetical protein n=1 Tax=Kaistia sp. MMO-174 TaxID=3081256 RepID=UPI003015DCBB
MILTDRQRVEILLPAQIMLGVLIAGVPEDQQAGPEFAECQRHLLDAAKEPVADLLPGQQRKILNRVTRVHREVSAPFTPEGSEVSKFGLIAFYWIKALVDCEFFIFAAGSSIDRAIELFIPAIEHAAQIEAVDRSAQKQARRMIGHFQRLGFYRGVVA